MNQSKQNNYRFEHQDEPDQKAAHVLFEGINEQAVLKKALHPIKTFGIFVKDEQGIVLGGATGISYYGCLYVDMLWIKEELRQQGLGTKLIKEAEAIGRERLCSFATVNTMDWEALPFYQKLGYAIEFVREGYENNSKMYLLRKTL
ncbi:GNAT family N-acetyltransferase [Candidatus Protochlamydia phocaeensis]|uniref:GNAT family N-acetyltransferase n=1 Tax=Candidatus Protochlamydia phocaeensis TaxID=1414722 RepID=UPI00083816B2|nr:GNAT family N-acetyltransferase [Candidatus Protochlamydia phocaeensis]